MCLMSGFACCGAAEPTPEIPQENRALSDLRHALADPAVISMDIFYMPLGIQTRVMVEPEQLESQIARRFRGKDFEKMRPVLQSILKDAHLGRSELAAFDVRFGFVLYDGRGGRRGSIYVNGLAPRAIVNGVPGQLTKPAFEKLFVLSVPTQEEARLRYSRHGQGRFVLVRRELDALRKRQSATSEKAPLKHAKPRNKPKSSTKGKS